MGTLLLLLLYFTSRTALFLLMLPFKRGSSRLELARKICCALFALLLTVNTVLFFAFNVRAAINETASENAHIAKLEHATQKGDRIALAYKTEPGAIYELEEHGIPFELIGPVTEDFETDGEFNRLCYKIEGEPDGRE